MAIKKKGLGKGLGALLTDENPSIDSDSITEIKIVNIEPNREQPRKSFDEESLIELADSIKQNGVITPILVCEAPNGYYSIIAGERRWRASKLAGLKTIPAIIKKYDEEKLFEISLIENLQRQDLNPLEEALGYSRLTSEYGLTQEDVASRVSKSRSYVANAMRLLNLPEFCLKALESGEISVGHAKVLLSLQSEETQTKLCKLVCENKLSVRDLEDEIKKLSQKPKKASKPDLNVMMAFEKVEKEISDIFGTGVKISNRNNKGKIQIEYYSAEDLDRILKILKKP